ncbi:MAG TPA: hypothetical protein VF988_12180, partial [Verrucomicrobiae bacterium]
MGAIMHRGAGGEKPFMIYDVRFMILLRRELATGKSPELAGWKACATIAYPPRQWLTLCVTSRTKSGMFPPSPIAPLSSRWHNPLVAHP